MDASSLEAELATAPPGFFDDISRPPVLTETGIASWYGPPYHHRAAADGTVFDEDAMTGAHRTLPLGTTVRVTNMATGQQVLVRITDRGPFVPGRVLDLSLGAAKAVGLYRAGVGQVRVEAFAHPNADPDGRWCVQTGAFKTEQDALDLKAALIARYRGSKVSEFQGPTGFWVRIDPAAHDRQTAAKIEDWIGAPDKSSQAYLVRVD
jgi:rare lipoprotein A